MAKIGYYTTDGVLRFQDAVISDSFQLMYNVDHVHLLAAVFDDNGLIAISPSFNFDTENSILGSEMYLMNNPILDPSRFSVSDFRTSGPVVIDMNGKFFNPLGSGGGTLDEPTQSGLNIANYSTLAEFLGVSNMQHSSSELGYIIVPDPWEHTVAKDNLGNYGQFYDVVAGGRWDQMISKTALTAAFYQRAFRKKNGTRTFEIETDTNYAGIFDMLGFQVGDPPMTINYNQVPFVNAQGLVSSVWADVDGYDIVLKNGLGNAIGVIIRELVIP